MDDGRARVNRVWGVIDRTTNNLLGEFPTREEADEFFNELLAADHRAGLHVEVVEAKGHATGSRAAKRAEAARPRFSEREGRLLLAAVYQAKRSAPHDADWRNLYKKLDRIWGDR